jgi:hypothetical protein
VPALKAAGADGTAGGITLSRRALLYFRWSAVVTWLAGAARLAAILERFTLASGYAAIGIGRMGTIMLFNAWS